MNHAIQVVDLFLLYDGYTQRRHARHRHLSFPLPWNDGV